MPLLERVIAIIGQTREMVLQTMLSSEVCISSASAFLMMTPQSSFKQLTSSKRWTIKVGMKVKDLTRI